VIRYTIARIGSGIPRSHAIPKPAFASVEAMFSAIAVSVPRHRLSELANFVRSTSREGAHRRSMGDPAREHRARALTASTENFRVDPENFRVPKRLARDFTRLAVA
jgi:hypothetical protein